MLSNCLLTRRGLLPLFSLSKRRRQAGVLEVPFSSTGNALLIFVIHTTVWEFCQPLSNRSGQTMRTKSKQTNNYYEHPCIRKHNDTSITKAVQCYAIGFYKTDLVFYWAYFSTPFCFKRLRKLSLRKASKRTGLHYFYFSLLQKVSENTSHSKYKFFNKK